MIPVLLVTPDCPSCREAQAVWEQVCAELHLNLRVQCPEGNGVVKTIPVLVVDGVPVYAGVPESGEALRVLSNLRRGQGT